MKSNTDGRSTAASTLSMNAKTLRLLIVEDHLEMLSSLAEGFEEEGYAVDTACTALTPWSNWASGTMMR